MREERSYARGDIVDFLTRGGESIVLMQSGCLRLSQIPTTVIEFLDVQRSEDELERHVEGRYGRAPKGALRRTLLELAELEIVRLV